MLFITDSSISRGIFKFPNTVGSPEKYSKKSYSYTMACPPVRGDNPQALAMV